MPEMPASRRKNTRYRCTGGVELRRTENAPPIFANLSDVSLEGCYVEAVSTLPAGAEVVFLMRVQGAQLRGRARVKTSHHAVGMGLEFLHLAPEDQQNLDFVVGTLAGAQDMQEDKKRTFVPEDPPERTPATMATATRTAHTASMAPPPRQPAPATGGMAPKIMRSIADLNELEQNLVKDRIDPRLIAQLHDSVEHVRQTAFTVQQWVELDASGGDPFEVLPQLEAGRMHMLTQLAHNVTADIDSGSINDYTVGISELFTNIDQLHRRLKKLLLPDKEST
jgi:hypothetical protein